MTNEQNKDFKFELLKSFHDQFAENQNHHQALLIKFISAIAVVVVGYAIVYSAKSKDILPIMPVDGKNAYSFTVLYFSNFLSQLVIWLLNCVNINIGYGFRRDQKVVANIRQKYLQDDYSEVFGRLAFRADSKSFHDYLPNFNTIFYLFCIAIQAVLYMSIFFVENYLLLDILLLLPILLSLATYILYYYIYKAKVTKA
jgi:hypothetical protein